MADNEDQPIISEQDMPTKSASVDKDNECAAAQAAGANAQDCSATAGLPDAPEELQDVFESSEGSPEPGTETCRPSPQHQASLERRSSRGRLLSKQNEIEEVEDEDHSPSSETSDATVVAGKYPDHITPKLIATHVQAVFSRYLSWL